MDMLWNLIYSQLFFSVPIPTKDFSGQTIIVTGANVGLGKEAARHFHHLNAEKIILAVRNLEKGEAAKKDIEASTSSSGAIEVWPLDLQSYESVKQFGKRAEGLKRLDVVVENAGIATHEYRTAEDNEATITTNVVSTFLLALNLLPTLRESALRYNITPHLVVVSSEVHAFTSFPEKDSPNIFKTLNEKETANMGDRYQVSKLLEVFTVRELAKSKKQPEVIMNYLNPGLCHSELAREGSWSVAILKMLLARTTEQGSRTLVHAAQASKESHGQYLSDCRVTPPSPLVRSEKGARAQERVWEELSQKLETIQPGILQNV
ncbi:MAG: hypothetical protein M1827_006639 [Pycnora praestabilis]|nr:MAG: hypothetical protein M1827_006639 [Pycnora praestabilis]